jgi:copper chaperone CopZ
MCNHCKANVEKALSNIDGVTAVRVDLAEGAAYIKGKEIDTETVIATINSLGYKYIEE